ncbi:MAG TPA: transposase [Thermoanaerobaculia bacterium]|nr:transposase [Thermoanaerobaculia bacterium]
MARPLRLEFPGSLWHITHRGNERRPTFHTDADRERFLEMLGETIRRFKWILTAYALMLNHYHVVVELTDADALSRGMKWLNGSYAQWFNREHERVGHLFQGRFNGFLIDKETYFLEVLRYVVLNPVRAGIVERPEEYVWTSYRATVGNVVAPEWLAIDDALVHFSDGVRAARERYRQFVAEGIGSTRRPWDDLIGAMYLGPRQWVERMRDRVELKPRSSDHPLSQRELMRPGMSAIVAAVATALGVSEDLVRRGRGGTARNVAAWIGCYEGMHTNRAIAAALRLRSDTQAANLVRKCDDELREDAVLRKCVDRCVATLRRGNWQLET